MAEKEITLRANPLKSVREAALEAADDTPLDQPDKHAKVMMEAWAARLKSQTDKFTKEAIREVKKKNSGVAEAEAEVITPTTPLYPWWNILIAGPFQPAPARAGRTWHTKFFARPNRHFVSEPSG